MSEAKEKSIGAQEAQRARRQDPVNRHADGASNVASVRNANPKRKYVLVNMADGDTMANYEESGFQREYQTKDGVKLFGARGLKEGELLTYRGHILMSIDKETAEKIRRQGAPGMGMGLNHWDKIEKRLVDKRQAASDLLRGIGGNRHMHVENESELTEEFGI